MRKYEKMKTYERGFQMKRILLGFLICFIILSMFSSVFATELNTKLNIIQQSSETKYLENDQGYISKTIIDTDEDTGEVTVELGLSNKTNISAEEKEQY